MLKPEVAVMFTGDALSSLEHLKVSSGRETVGEVISDALSFYEWTREQVEAGRTVGSFQGDLPHREVELPFRRS